MALGLNSDTDTVIEFSKIIDLDLRNIFSITKNYCFSIKLLKTNVVSFLF